MFLKQMSKKPGLFTTVDPSVLFSLLTIFFSHTILNPPVVLALRLQSTLLLGTVVILNRQADYLAGFFHLPKRECSLSDFFFLPPRGR